MTLTTTLALTFIASIHLISAQPGQQQQPSCPTECDYCLTQTDFDAGTYRIRLSGTYCLSENISFNPVPGNTDNPNSFGSWFPTDEALYPGCLNASDGAYALGFFAAISIETSNVIIDLNDNLLAMHFQFYIQQRFFALIEIGSMPFLPNFGPADFGIDFIEVSNIEIKNGELGLTSHHAIHSNNATNVIIQDLRISDFEVCGIQLNGFKNAQLLNLEIGPSFQNVPMSGYYSNARFLLLAYWQLLAAINERNLEMPSVSFGYLSDGDSLTLNEIFDNLVSAMDLVFRDKIRVLPQQERNTDFFQSANSLFGNDDGLPDGSAIYGILLNSHSVAVHGFGTSTGHSENVLIQDVDIKDLVLNVNEIPAVHFNLCEDPPTEHGIARGPFGDVMDVTLMVDPTQAELIENFDLGDGDLSSLQYIGNVLADAQIALYLFGEGYVDNNIDYSFGSYISPYLLQWALQDFDYDGNIGILPSCVEFVCNGDIMFHTNKGVMGIRMDGVDEALLNTVSIRRLENSSPLASFACADYSGPHDGGTEGTRVGEGGMNTDMRGISMTNSDGLMDGLNEIEILETSFGDTTAIDLMEGSILAFSSDTIISINSLRGASGLSKNLREYDFLVSINKTPYPNNFDLCTINIEDTSQVIDAPQHLSQDDCIDPFAEE